MLIIAVAVITVIPCKEVINQVTYFLAALSIDTVHIDWVLGIVAMHLDGHIIRVGQLVTWIILILRSYTAVQRQSAMLSVFCRYHQIR